MKGTDIEIGGEYLFLATESPARQSLVGTRFTVTEIRRVWRRKKGRRVQTMRYFNEDGVGARADELAELDDAKRWTDLTQSEKEAIYFDPNHQDTEPF